MQKQKEYFYIITVRGPFGHETFSGAYTVTRSRRARSTCRCTTPCPLTCGVRPWSPTGR